MAFFSDALGHSAFTGVAIGTLCGLADATWCAVALAVVFALLFTWVQRKTRYGQRHGHRRLFLHCGGVGHLHRHPGRPQLYQVQQPSNR